MSIDFWRFADPAAVGSVAMAGSYDATLVLLSYVVSTLSAVSSMTVMPRILVTRSVPAQRAWLAVGAIACGSGVWAMHFTAMLAFSMGVDVTYDAGWTAGSVVPAIVGGAVTFYLMTRGPLTVRRLILSGLAAAVGIGTMHYLGMEAMRADAVLVYDPALFALSILVAWGLATLSLALLRPRADLSGRSWWQTAAAPAVAGAAVCGMHFTAMAAAEFYEAPATGSGSLSVPPLELGVAIVGLASLFLILALAGVAVDRRLERAHALTAAGQQRHRAVLETMADGLLVFDEGGRVESSNRAAQRLLARSEADLHGLATDDLFRRAGSGDRLSPDDLVEVVDRGEGVAAQLDGVLPDGTCFPADLRASRTRVGEQDLLSVVFRDITQQVAAMARMERLVAAVDHATECVIIADPEGTVVYANPATKEVLGYGADVLVGSRREDLAEVKLEGFDLLYRAIAAREPWSGTLVTRRADSSLARVETTMSPARNGGGEVTSFVSVGRDVTEQHALEAQLRSAQKLESIGQLAAGIAHEINTPTQYVGDNMRFLREAFRDLTGVVTRLDGLRADARAGTIPTDALERADTTVREADLEYLLGEIPSAIDQSLEGLEHVAKIVRAMKEFSHPAQDLTSVDLNQAIRSTVTVATNEWRYVADLDLDLDPDLPLVPCVPGEINQVVLNMVVNAAHAIEDEVGSSGEKGRIEVGTRLQGDWAELRVSDTGGGIPPDVRDRILDPFFTTKDVGRGTGQGLAICHSVVVQRHGGTLTFETEPGVGTTFLVRLPLTLPGGREAVA